MVATKKSKKAKASKKSQSSASKSSARASAKAEFDEVVKVVEAHRDKLLKRDDVVNVRAGYRFKNGWITNEPAVVIAVRRKKGDAEVSSKDKLPKTIGGVPVDVTNASPIERARASKVSGAEAAPLAGDLIQSPSSELALPGWDRGAGEEEEEEEGLAEAVAVPLLDYEPPPGGDEELNKVVEDGMTVICHVSPDAGWKTLGEFLQEVKKTLTIGMYDFTAPHIKDGLVSAMSGKGKQLRLILDPKVALPSAKEKKSGKSNKANDITEDEIRDTLAEVLKKRFTFDWAAVKLAGKVTQGIYPTAYHIKVAVRDSNAFWLSSGNWQSSNQPDIDSLNKSFGTILNNHNREWHVVIEHPKLAKLYEKFLKWDMEQADPLQQTEEAAAVELMMPDILVEEAAQAPQKVQKFAPEVFRFTDDNPLRVQPLLTPDNYAEKVLPVIKSAKETLYFQNQYINVPKSTAKGKIDPGPFLDLLEALRGKIDDGVDVRVILRGEFDTRPMLEALQYYGFDMSHFKLLKGCHNKGIIVDSEILVVGSHNYSIQGTLRNRDASLIFYNSQIAKYYQKVFLYDWEYRAQQGTLEESESAPELIARSAPTPRGKTRVSWDNYYEDVD